MKSFITLLAILASPWLVGAAIVALWHVGAGIIIAVAAVLGLVWVLALCAAAREN